MLELAVLLILFAGFLFTFKVLGLIFKAGFFFLTLPFQILGAAFGVIFVIMVLPFAAVIGAIAMLFAPILAISPLLPLLMVGLGLYLLTRS